MCDPKIPTLNKSFKIPAELVGICEKICVFLVETEDFSKKLYDEEITRIVEEKFEIRRIRTYSSGRYCARLGLEKYSIHNYPLLVNKQSHVIWPKHFIGSISHTDSFTVVGISNSKKTIGLGIDIEEIGRIDKELWPLFFTNNEIRELNLIDESAYFSTVYFSLKEALYKLLSPLFNLHAEFHDCEVINIDNNSYCFKAISTFPIEIEKINIKVLEFNNHIITIVKYEERPLQKSIIEAI
jgi:phosphopantetheine--protein transferase-like protein